MLASSSVDSTKLADGAVTYAKLQDISATKRVLGRNTTGSGDAEEVTVDQVFDWVSGTPTQGDMFFRGASATSRLPAGFAGQRLKSLGPSSSIIWSDPDPQIQSISASVASDALTVTINQTDLISFRSSTLTDGSVTWRKIPSNISLTVPSGATLGTYNGRAARLYLLALDNSGTIEVAICNSTYGVVSLDESNLISTTAISTSATSANSVYSTSARSSLPYRVVGFIDITESTAGQWATAPTLVQGSGGQALTAMSSIGYTQYWQDFTGSRSASTNYYNTTGKPIYVSVKSTTADGGLVLQIAGISVASCGQSGGSGNDYNFVSGIVPPGISYMVIPLAGTIAGWYELR